MKLFIDTTENNIISLYIIKDGNVLIKRRIKAVYSQAEKLLPLIDKTLGAINKKLKDITIVEVNNIGGSFSSLRLGVITANSLNYALGIRARDKRRGDKINIILPIYSGDPNITKKKTSVD